ncbi:IS200/IS605 family accessory protein TnpB-related protein [Scytonema sp. PCC 10023]|uniref:IS200/IS605 family accessory protein TnpB-related protein n=1 Tax=Scytonema sp. PCC 10023 TaxID=1680591 RepID=UPI0039C6B8DA
MKHSCFKNIMFGDRTCGMWGISAFQALVRNHAYVSGSQIPKIFIALRVQRKRNNQMRDAVNKAARFIINQCLNDRVGNLVIGWNEGQKNGSSMGKRNNQNFVVIPTGRLIERLKQLCLEYGITLTITLGSVHIKSIIP